MVELAEGLEEAVASVRSQRLEGGLEELVPRLEKVVARIRGDGEGEKKELRRRLARTLL